MSLIPKKIERTMQRTMRMEYRIMDQTTAFLSRVLVVIVVLVGVIVVIVALYSLVGSVVLTGYWLFMKSESVTAKAPWSVLSSSF